MVRWVMLAVMLGFVVWVSLCRPVFARIHHLASNRRTDRTVSCRNYVRRTVLASQLFPSRAIAQ